MSETSAGRRLWNRLSRGRIAPPEGRAGIAVLGHRDYVGGMWEEIGALQLEFLIERGLKPEHVLLDVACGALRGGVHFIRYLDAGNYLGIDKEKRLIDLGIKEELGEQEFERKRPEFVISDSFEFERFSKRADYSLAQSLFTHLNSVDIELCLRNLRRAVAPGHEFYATFLNGSEESSEESHSHKKFEYTPEQMSEMGSRHSWESVYIGDWRHPRRQMMMQYTAA